MSEIKVSIFASAVRPQFFGSFLESLQGTTEKYEVVFAGHCAPQEVKVFEDCFPEFTYIHTGRIKPAQCYEIARRACIGETIAWTADDCVHTTDLYGKAYRHWKNIVSTDAFKLGRGATISGDPEVIKELLRKCERVALSIQTEENRQFCDMHVHSFFGCQFNTPLMAPLALMSNKVMQDLGGFDRRYICGQYENDAIMRLIEAGGRVEIFGDRENKIIIDHYARHGIHRPFAKGYGHDREILEGSWTNGSGKVFTEIQRPFEPYEDTDLLVKSQSFNLPLWV